jgi:hypothetical protein
MRELGLLIFFLFIGELRQFFSPFDVTLYSDHQPILLYSTPIQMKITIIKSNYHDNICGRNNDEMKICKQFQESEAERAREKRSGMNLMMLLERLMKKLLSFFKDPYHKFPSLSSQ